MKKNKLLHFLTSTTLVGAFSSNAFLLSGCSNSLFYTVTFNTNGGSLLEPIKVQNGQKITEPNQPTKENYHFNGWYIDENCTQAYDFSLEVKSDLTIYAGWSQYHTSCVQKNKTTLSTTTYLFNLDSEQYSVNDFNFYLSGQDSSKLIICDTQINKNILQVSIKPKTISEESLTKYTFELNIQHAEGWTENHKNMQLSYQIVDEEIKQHDELSWKHAIEYMASCKHPTIFISTIAAYVLQQMFNMYLVASQLAIQNNCTISNPDYLLNDFIFLIPDCLWNCKKQTKGEGTASFWCNYNNLVKEDFGYTNIIEKSKEAGETEIDPTKGNQMILTNMQDFDLTLDDYDKTRADYINFNGHDWVVSFINKIMDIYEAIDPDIKFNFVVPDYAWRNICESHYKKEEYSKLQTRMFRKMDKFYIVSDGSYTWWKDNPAYFNYVKDVGYISAAQQDETMNKIRTLNFDDAVQFYNNVNPWMFYNNEKYCYHFQASTKSTFADCNLNNDFLTKESTYKSSTPLLLTSTYKNWFSNSTNYNNYVTSYLDLFHYHDEGMTQKFSDYVSFDTYSNFDHNKKNLIWCLPGSFRASKSPSEVLWSSCRKIMDKIKENYPIDQWNYIYKFHPGCSTQDVQETFNKLFDASTPSEWPSNTIVLNQYFPFEYLVTLDQTLVSLGLEQYYHLIDPTTFMDDKPSGIMTGFDLISTCYYGVMSILVNEYGYSWDAVKKLIQTDSYFIPRKFRISDYAVGEEDYSQFNVSYTNNFYISLYQTGEFLNPNEFEIV